ncbi:MAG: hypothetical protein K6F08_03065 [bacterium]|nr:hypothetical protein [bacterium]
MKVALIVILVILVIFLIMIFPLRARLQLLFNLLDGFSVYSIKVLFIKILLGRSKLTIKGIKTENAVNKLYSDKNNPNATNEFNFKLLKRVKANKLNAILTFGAINPYFTALISGAGLSLLSIFNGIVLDKNPDCRVFVAANPRFYENVCELVLQVSLSLSLMQLLISFIELKKEKQNV